MSVTTLATYLDVAESTLRQIRAACADFPQPLELPVGKVWRTTDIDTWVAGQVQRTERRNAPTPVRHRRSKHDTTYPRSIPA